MSQPVRTIHFPPVTPREKDKPVASEETVTRTPDLILFGRMIADNEEIARRLKGLVSSEEDYHGTLQTIRTAAIALSERADQLISQFLGERKKPAGHA